MRKLEVVLCWVASLAIMAFSAPGVLAQEDAYSKGMRAYFKRDYAAAVRYLKEYAARQPEARSYYFLGYAQYELTRRAKHPAGRTDFWADTEAARAFKEAYLIDPEFSLRVARSGKKKE